MKIGERIKYRREELGLSQDELARRLGYKSRSSINKIENDASGLPQTKIVAIANALQTTPSYIMGWQEVQKKNDTLTDIVVQLRSDDELLSLIEGITQLDPVQRATVKQVVDTFLSTKG
jgi:transcriptional regulator with XRE-family HTH domain